VAEDLVTVFARFHREVLLPDMQRLIGDAVGGLRQEMNAHFDAIYQRLDRLETEYQMIVAGMKRIEERLDRLEQRVDKLALRSELLELKTRIDSLQEQIRTLEARLEQ